MKKPATLACAFVLCAVALFQSCSKEDEDANNLTSEIVGTYTGTYNSQFFELDIVGERIRVTKIDDRTVQIDPIDDGLTEAFKVELAETTGGLLFTIPLQNSVYLGTIRGYDGIQNDPDNHGAFVYADREFVYGIWLNVGGVDYREIFIGYKD